MIIYKATNTINGMSYIGQTIFTLDERRMKHERRDDKSYFQNAIESHGKDIFEWEVICECSTPEELSEKEVFYIEHFNTLRPNGYNLTKGGEGSFWTGDNNPAKLDWVRQKISNSKKGCKREDLSERNKVNKGKTYEELYGKEHADRMKQMASKKNKGKNNPMYGVERTDEQRESQRTKMAKYEYTIIDPDGNEYKGISLRKLTEQLNLNRGSMRRILNTDKNVKGWKCIGIEIGFM